MTKNRGDTMNAYEELLGVIQGESKKNSVALIQIGTMSSATSCSIGSLELSGNDLIVAEHLTTGYSLNETTFISPLKKGDEVAIYRFSDEKYIILERLVRL